MLETTICSLRNADIALFPMFEKKGFEYEKFIPKKISKESIVGIASLHPFFPNRLKFFNEGNKVFFGNNTPLTFSFMDYEELEKAPISEYWDRIMTTAQSGICPRIWLLAPEEVCKYIISMYIGESNNDSFYFHDEDHKDNRYFAIEKVQQQFKTHLMF